MKKSFFVVVLLSSSLLAHKEVVREIAQDIERSDYLGAKAHLTRLSRINLSQKKHKDILEDLKVNAETIRKDQEDSVRIGNSWADSCTTFGGLTVVLYSLRGLLDARSDYDAESGLTPIGIALLLVMVSTGAYAAYKGYKCWYQNRCIGAAQKVEECVEDALNEVKKG